MKAIYLVASTLLALLEMVCSAADPHDLVYPVMYRNEKLATRINCQVREPQLFHYSSTTDLWGLMGGQITLSADVTLHCLGDDRGGKYESEALKYKAELSNLVLEEDKRSDKDSPRRQKRGVGEFFSNSWERVKKFFKRVFGSKTEETHVTHVTDDFEPVDKRQETPSAEEPIEDFGPEDYSSLYSIPFQFVQLANGSIPEIRFSENEVDGRVKNFKRHLVDAFATQLNFNQKLKSVVEKSVMGEHTSKYNITVDDDSAASLHTAGISFLALQVEPTVVVKKVVTEGDILHLAPSEALNDREKMDLEVLQMQVFQGGRMISSSGTSSLTLLPDIEARNNRIKREDADDVTSYIQAQSSFNIQLQKRHRRALSINPDNPENEGSYFAASREAEVEDNSERRKVRFNQKIKVDMSAFLESLSQIEEKVYNEEMQALFEIVDREVELELDRETDSVSSTVRKLLSKQMMQNMCSKNFSVCKDFLQLLASAGGSEAEEVILSFLSQENTFSTEDIRSVADILSDIPRPSATLISSIGELIQGRSFDTNVFGAICLSLGHLGSKANVEGKKIASEVLQNMLIEKINTCHSDPSVDDVLEAIGNLNSERMVPNILKMSTECGTMGAIQIACAHALRHSIHLPLVQEWIINVTKDGNCEILREVVGSMMDKIQDQEMTPDSNLWPRFGFNNIDELLNGHLENSSCPIEDTLLYFNRKKNPRANEIASNYFGPGSEPWNRKPNSRQKRRAIWDDLNCKEWTEDDTKYKPIQDREEFASDRATYNRRKSCLAFRRLGIKGASAEVYAGMFAGVKEPSDPPKYKLFTKFVSGLNFLGHKMEIGSFYFYHHSGKTNAYVRIMGRTRQEFTHEGCTPTDLKYRPLKNIPLFAVNIGPVQLSLGIHLSSQLAMNTACPGKDVYQLEPLTSVRIGGEAMGTVLFARGSINLGGNFNYKLQFTFTPSPDMCLKGSHGYDPMSISFETYYQHWNLLKGDWGKSRTWKPSFLSWDVSRGDLKQWFEDTCIVNGKSNSTYLQIERELE